MIVGLNSAPSSVAIGHYYQGRVGQRQLRRLVATGALDVPDGTYFERVAARAGIGFTDIVKRPTVGEKDVSRAEIAHGEQRLVAELSARAVPLVVCVFRHPAELVTGGPVQPGLHPVPTAWGGRVFRMPGPFEAQDRVASIMRELIDAL